MGSTPRLPMRPQAGFERVLAAHSPMRHGLQFDPCLPPPQDWRMPCLLWAQAGWVRVNFPQRASGRWQSLIAPVPP